MMPNCSAHQSGAIAKGDVLVAIEGEPCDSLEYPRVCERMLGRCARIFAWMRLCRCMRVARARVGHWPTPGGKPPNSLRQGSLLELSFCRRSSAEQFDATEQFFTVSLMRGLLSACTRIFRSKPEQQRNLGGEGV